MRKLLVRLIDLRTVGALLVVGVFVLVGAVSFLGPAGEILGIIIAVAIVILALFVLFAYWIKRMNADIDSDRTDLRRELDATMEEMDEIDQE